MHRTHIPSSAKQVVFHGCFALAWLSLAQAVFAQQPLTVGQRLAQDLTWTQPEREQRFAHMDRLFPVNRLRHGRASPLPQGDPLAVQLPDGESVAHWMQRDRMAGVLVLQHGRIRLEHYGLGATRETRWTSFSVTKSLTSTLAGFALRDGYLHSADDPVTRYLPELSGSAYEGVTVRQLLTMTSGVRWVEDYTAPDSDNVKLYSTPSVPGHDTVVDYMRRLPREASPGSTWVYKTGETDLTGVLVRRAVGTSLSAYLQRVVWQPMGAQSDAFWIAENGKEYGGSGLSATLRDFGRFGEYVRTHRNTGWLAEATRTQVALPGGSGNGYGYQWWTYPDGSFAALGIFGQSLLIDPKRDLVVVTLGAWPKATSEALVQDRRNLWAAVRSSTDRPAR